MNELKPMCACGCGGYINLGRRFLSGHNFNHHTGNNRIYTGLSIEQKLKRSVSNKGKKRSVESCKNISDSLKGRKLSETHRLNISNSKKGVSLNLTEDQYRQRSESRKGENNPFYGKVHKGDSLTICKNARLGILHTEETKKKISDSGKGRCHSKETILKCSLRKIGSLNPNYGKIYSEEEKKKFGNKNEKHPNWKGGIGRLPYSSDWNKDKRLEIKERDGYVCQNVNCKNVTDTLTVHHIDYNKKNCDNQNLITLCVSCNVRANYNREYHQQFYQELIKFNYESRKIKCGSFIH